VPFDPKGWKAKDEQTGKECISEEPSNNDQSGQKENVALSVLGSDPPTLNCIGTDAGMAGKLKKKNWGTIPQNSIGLNTPQCGGQPQWSWNWGRNK
jgi:hypothetical protein